MFDKLFEDAKGTKTNLHALEANGIYEGVIENGEALLTDGAVPNCRKTLISYSGLCFTIIYSLIFPQLHY